MKVGKSVSFHERFFRMLRVSVHRGGSRDSFHLFLPSFLPQLQHSGVGCCRRAGASGSSQERKLAYLHQPREGATEEGKMVLDVAFVDGGKERKKEGASERRILAAQLPEPGFSSHRCMTKMLHVPGRKEEGRRKQERRPFSLRWNSATTQFMCASGRTNGT